MKKKLGTLIGLGIATLLLTGCDGTVTREIRHAGFSLSSNEFVCSTLMPANEDTKATDTILYTNGSYAITDDGKLYELSLSQPYSNEQNCKRIEFSINVIAYMDDSILKGSDNKFYYAPGTTNSTPLTEVTENDSNYQLYQLLLGSDTVKKVITVDSNAGTYYVLESDGTVYQYTITRQDYNSPYTLTSKTPVYEKSEYGEIIDFNYAGESTATYIKTQDEIYRMQITNEEECTEYADIACEYELKKDETLTKYYTEDPKILYFGPSILITTYGKEFTLS